MKLMIDLDGTMYHGTKIIESAYEFMKEAQRRNIDVLFLTNNATRTPIQAAEHMLKMGYENIQPEQFYTSAMASADEVKRLSDKRRAYMIGELGLKEALIQNGFELVDHDADFVFVGLDRNATYRDYSLAFRQLHQGAVLVGTNSDTVLLSEEGVNVGNGSIVHMLETCSGQTSMQIGKPSSVILDCALRYTGWSKEEVLIVGDNLHTDILCGIQAGVKSALVLTGISKREDVEKTGIKPDIIVESMMDLFKFL